MSFVNHERTFQNEEKEEMSNVTMHCDENQAESQTEIDISMEITKPLEIENQVKPSDTKSPNQTYFIDSMEMSKVEEKQPTSNQLVADASVMRDVSMEVSQTIPLSRPEKTED